MVYEKEYYCFECGKKYSVRKIIFECESCGGSLDVRYDYGKIKRKLPKNFRSLPVSHWKYFLFFPVKKVDRELTLNEGCTPLVRDNENANLYFKYEGLNPTGSFKDRGSTVEIVKAKEFGAKKISCASTGNMGASVACYARRAGIKARIYVPSFAPVTKLRQMRAYGAEVRIVKGSYTDALERAEECAKKGFYLMGDYPLRGEGEKSVGFEILDEFGFKVPKWIVCPIGNGTLIYAVWKACKEFKRVGLVKKLPKMVGVQAKGCNPVVRAFENGWEKVRPLKGTRTVASAINCPDPMDGTEALHALRESKGVGVSVSDKEIIGAMKELARKGILAEPAGAVSYAGYKKLELGGKAVLIVTGHGLKDMRFFR